MSRIDLLEPILTGGVNQPNFFNGRILTAEDLSDLQVAIRTRHDRLGKAIGTGVVQGLRTSRLADGTGIRVDSGCGITRSGKLVVLPDARDVNVVAAATDVDEPDVGFADCETLSTALPSNTGIYVLAMSPASDYQGSAPMVSTTDEGVARGCGSRYLVEGVRFRVVPLNLKEGVNVSKDLFDELQDLRADGDGDSLSRYRNIVAHICLGTAAVLDRIQDPLSPTSPHDALERLFDTDTLDECDLPVTLFLWASGGIRFIDDWSVRRIAGRTHGRLVEVAATNGAERLEQFIDHLHDLLATGDVSISTKIQRFMRFVPAAGYIPASGGTAKGFKTDILSNFVDEGVGEIAAGPFVELLRRSESLAPVDLDADPCLELLEIVEHEDAVDTGQATQRYVAYLDRATESRHVEDLAVAVFTEAWSAYQGAIERGAFVSLRDDTEELRDLLTVQQAMRRISDVANRFAAMAGAGHMDHAGTVRALNTFRMAQSQLVALFAKDRDGTRVEFAKELDSMLQGKFQDDILDGRSCAALRGQGNITKLIAKADPTGYDFGDGEFQRDDDGNGFRMPGTFVNTTLESLTYDVTAFLRDDGDDEIVGYRAFILDENDVPRNEIKLDPGEMANVTVVVERLPGADPIDEIKVDLQTRPQGDVAHRSLNRFTLITNPLIDG